MAVTLCCKEHPEYAAQREPKLSGSPPRCACWLLWDLSNGRGNVAFNASSKALVRVRQKESTRG